MTIFGSLYPFADARLSRLSLLSQSSLNLPPNVSASHDRSSISDGLAFTFAVHYVHDRGDEGQVH